MRRPRPRGPLSQALDVGLVQEPGSRDPELGCLVRGAVGRSGDVLYDDDVQVSLTMLYELHYTGLDGVDDRWEWDPTLIGVRGILEDAFERRLRALVPAGPPAYDGDVLFENLELSRTVAAAGGLEVHAPDLFVARRPPTARHFFRQRVRQAYDSFATPGRLAAELSVLPALALAGRRGRLGRATVALALAAVGVAEVGRRRASGRTVFGWTAPLWAPPWLAERSVCSWLAVVCRLGGGISYAGGRLRTAAHGSRQLRRTISERPPLPPLPNGLRGWPDDDQGKVAWGRMGP